jgi:hypothetical protein
MIKGETLKVALTKVSLPFLIPGNTGDPAGL